MKKLFIKISFFCFILFSCSTTEKIGFKVDGQFQLNLSLIDEVIIGKSSSRTFNLPLEEFLITILTKDSSTVIENTYYSEIANGILLNGGEYIIKAYSGKLNDFSFNTPVYYGEANFEIYPDQFTQLDLSVALINAKIQVNFSDTLQILYPNINVTIRSDSGKSITLRRDNNNILYVIPQHLYFDVNYENNPQENWLTFQIPNVRANDFYKITLSTIKQGADINLVIEEEDIIDMEFNLPLNDGYIIPENPVIIDSIETVFPDDVYISSKIGLDNFVELGITKIDGNLTVNTIEITDLSRLSTLKEVTGNVSLTGLGSVVNLNGFQNLKKIGNNLRISTSYQTKLNSFLYFVALDSVMGDVYLSSIPAEIINNLEFIHNLKYVGGDLKILNNQIVKLSGLENLETIVGDITFENNRQLSNYCGLNPNVLINNRGNYISRNNKYNPTRTSLENLLCRQ
ncbi:DUF4493 domain-containing protein [Flammeovirga aprica]|uniref:DUF4493 domain-containing protein n=1 Tax=Flammeovirga aprica JL-4 TaxID=694437 RepID=A0A7X9S178_9BACT|nr:DUF4493 domain-containing protein [Flammeovirga aprica]NME72292.1 DUF4493 domain-containing protein [Flammeovirga aprica JL-4]